MSAAAGTTVGTTGGRVRRGLFSRSSLPLLGVLLLLGLLLVVSALRSPPPEPIPFDLDSAAPNGLRGLDLWLQELGYDVRRTSGLRFELPDNADLVFVYPNQLSYSMEEAATLLRWVEQGGTLVLVGPNQEDGELEQTFGVRAVDLNSFSLAQEEAQPLAPEGTGEAGLDWSTATAALDLAAAPNAVPVLRTTGGEPTVAVQQVGQGVVWHMVPGAAFVNRGLREENQADWLPPILRTVRPGGVVVFDVYHQFGLSRVGERITTLQDWLYRTPSGWAVAFAVLATVVFLVLQGRRLGPSVATTEERRRREAGEYVEAMAGLVRRAHLARDVAVHQRQRLKRGLAQRRAIDPELGDDVFLQRLSYSEPSLPADTVEAVRQTLGELRTTADEQRLVKLAATVDDLLKRCG